MKIIKKVLVILAIVVIILPTIYSNVFAKTKDEIIQSILEDIVIKMTDASSNGDPTQVNDSEKIKEIALYWRQQADANGLEMQDFIDFDLKMLNGNVLGDVTTSLYLCYKEATQNSDLEDQVNNPDGANEEKKQYKNKYPSEWTITNMMRIYSQDVKAEIDKRKREDKIDKEYDSAEDETNKDRDDEQEELKGSQSSTGLLGASPNNGASHTPDEIIGEAQNFKNSANGAITINGKNLKTGSDTFYNILLSIGIFLAIAIGMYLGVKFMLSNAEDKAKVKEALIPYIAGCIVIFSAFIIWKLAILLLSGIQ